ncbi:MAG: S41 family peptidase [Clostridium sp.]|nr:S41 family peptidase [Clostridium sp.]
MTRKLVISAALAAASLAASAVTPLWVRDIAISPDGRQLAFTYRGDIYLSGADGSNPRCLTPGDSREWRPVWSPDGSEIAFASDREGGADIFVIPAAGGAARRLTYNSASEFPETFTPDGKSVIFSAAIQDQAASAAFPARSQTELYSVPVAGGVYRQIAPVSATNIFYLPSADGSYLYEDVKGSEDRWRKHHVSSIARDLWRFDAPTGRYTKLTTNVGEDRNAVTSPDGHTIYFLSERDGGSFNVYSAPADNPEKVTRLTDFTDHPVRFLSVASDGTLSFGYNGEAYTMRPGEAPRKVALDIATREYPSEKRIAVSGPDTDGAVSASGKQFAFTNRGEVFVTSVKYPSIKQVTHTPEAESHLSWGKDDRELYYDSRRDGAWNIYRATINRDADPDFSNATIVDELRIFPNDGVDRSYPKVSPDGKKLAYVKDRVNLWVFDIASGEEHQLTETSTAHRNGGFDVEWSPDSRWLTFAELTPIHDPYSDIAVVNAETGEKHLITNTGYFDENPHWAFDGDAIIFLSERYGMRNHASWGSQYDVMVTFLTQDAYDRFILSEEDYALLKDVEREQKNSAKKNDSAGDSKKKGKKKTEEKKAEETAPKAYDFANLEDRTVRLTPGSADISDAIVSSDGSKLYYMARFEDDYDLWKKDLRKGDVSLVSHQKNGTTALRSDDDGNIYMIGREVKKFDTGNERPKNITTSTRMKVDPQAERRYMFDYVEREERERFYDKGMHGVDWDALTANYRRFLPHIDNNADFSDMLSELLGELNVSHTGSRYYGPSATDPTASLGLLYDMTYGGPGLRVDEVVARGPFDRASTALKPGMIITAINGVVLTDSVDNDRALANIARQKTLVSFTDPSTGRYFEEVVLPISQSALSSLLYDRWVAQREADVDRLSGGRLGYVHLQSMDDASFRRVYAKLLGEFKGKEGVVIDTRWNGGGRLHEDIEVLFSGDKYLQQIVHGVPTSEMPSRRWNKPSIMLIGEANYSNAHGTPWVYKHTGLGKLVGMPVPGTMTSVNWQRQQDPSLVFGIPVTGYLTDEGKYLENSQLEPDYKIANTPERLAAGEDEQLEKAVEVLLRDLDAK